MSRVLALDIGTVRVGAAVSDPAGIIAQGLGVWQAEGWLDELDGAVRKYKPAVIVLGLPVRTDGRKSEAADRVLEIAGDLKARYPECDIVTLDERFTTVIAQRALLEADVSRRRRKKSIDKLAAVIILEDWLESHRV